MVSRNYGNTSVMENIIRSKYTVSPNMTTSQAYPNQEKSDCLSCNKHITGKIPNNNRCKLICGNGKCTTTPKSGGTSYRAISKAVNKLQNQMTD